MVIRSTAFNGTAAFTPGSGCNDEAHFLPARQGILLALRELDRTGLGRIFCRDESKGRVVRVIVVGAGISGLTIAHALLRKQPDIDLRIFEKDTRVGGKVWTEQTPEGYACEWGVNGFLNNKPRTLELAKDLRLEVHAARAEAARRYVYRSGALHQLPESPPAFLTSGLMSIPGRLRVLCEPFIPRGSVPDESLAEFARRRLGPEARDALIDPMAAGVFAGKPDEMSLKSCFPRIHDIEMEFGSLIRGMVQLKWRAKKEGKGPGPGPGPAGRLSSFSTGMSLLTDALADRLGERLQTGLAVNRLAPAAKRWQVQLSDGSIEEADQVVLTVPAFAQSEMLRELAPDLSELVGQIQYPPLSVVCLGFDEQQLGAHLDGFGFLVPSTEDRDILGTVVDSNVFDARAPEGKVLFRTMLGGARSPETARLPESQLFDRVRKDLRDILGIDREPEFGRAYLHEHAIPQYRPGHAQRLDDIRASVARYPGLHLGGNAYRGVSLNDCVDNGWRIAGNLLSN